MSGDPAATPPAITSYPALGFGQQVSLQPEMSRVNVSRKSTLTAQLQSLARAGSNPLLLVVAGGTYAFGNQVFEIRHKNLTITAAEGESVVLKNIKLSIDIDGSDNVLIHEVHRREQRVHQSLAALPQGRQGQSGARLQQPFVCVGKREH
jgi:hypothetical protein